MQSKSSRIIYTGYADRVDGVDNSWKVIEDTKEARVKALADGYTAFTVHSLSHEPDENQDEKDAPVRYGPLILDVDHKENPIEAVNYAKHFVLDVLNKHLEVRLESLRYWISGGKGVHIEIPDYVFGAEDGHQKLHLINKQMVLFMKSICPGDDQDMIDLSMYSGRKGKLLRVQNIKRANGRYKVPISYQELLEKSPEELLALADRPREKFSSVHVKTHSVPMIMLYQSAMSMLHLEKKMPKLNLGNLFDCGFIHYCWFCRKSLSEPEWWGLINVLMSLGEDAIPLIHLFSYGYPGYSQKETDAKIRQVESSGMPHTCQYLKTLHNCGQDCQVVRPAHLWGKTYGSSKSSHSNFFLEEDGVYYQKEMDKPKEFVCTPVKVKGKIRCPKSKNWGRVVRYKNPENVEEDAIIYMRDIVGRGDLVRSNLADLGVEFARGSKVQTLFLEYLETCAPKDNIMLAFNKIGWHDDTYVLPDSIYGGTLDREFLFDTPLDNLHQVSGSLEDWKQNVGKYCKGNSLLVLLTSFALTGPVLRPLLSEGVGIHVYGSSSSGKTTIARVAGSICGGGSNNGYTRQWSSTHNALENTAVMHNDNLLVLDEIGQASSETIFHVPYMLINGQGRARMKSDASARDTKTWKLNFLSTGELTINEKIRETGKFTFRAGQEVRVINLPIDSGNGLDVYEDIHGFESSAKFSNYLGEHSVKYYGAPLRAFLSIFCNEILKSQKIRMDWTLGRLNFVANNTPKGASNQISRVAQKFGLIGKVGEFAIKHGILPYEPGEALRAAQKWFRIWVESRGTIIDYEISVVLRRFQDHLSTEYRKYIPIEKELDYHYQTVPGYTITNKLGEESIFMSRSTFTELLKSANRDVIVRAMCERGWLECTSNGNIKYNLHNAKRGRETGYFFVLKKVNETDI